MSEQMANLLREKVLTAKDADGKHLPPSRLAALVGVKQQTLSTFLHGQGITLETAQKLADYFCLSLTENGTH